MDGKCEGYPTDPKTIEGQFFNFRIRRPGHSPVKLLLQVGGSALWHHDEYQRYVNM